MVIPDLHGCEICFLSPREEQRLRVFEMRELRRMSGPKRGEEMGGWGKVYNVGLHSLYSSSVIRMIISRKIRLALHIACMG
jgi:hypothetical protein